MKKKDIVLLERILKILRKHLIQTQGGMPLQYIREYEKVLTGFQVLIGMMNAKREKEKGAV